MTFLTSAFFCQRDVGSRCENSLKIAGTDENVGIFGFSLGLYFVYSFVFL